jgi:hypothetical protein
VRATPAFLGIGAVVAGALALRVWALWWGWPHSLNPDEILYLPNALRMAADRTLNTGAFHNSHLFTYVCLAEIAIVYLGGRLIGVFDSAAAFGQFVWSHESALQLMARATSAVMGTATVFVVYRAAVRLFRAKTAAVCAAILLAIAPVHIHYSRMAVNDVCMTLFVALTAAVTIRLVQSLSPRFVLLAGTCAGLAAGAKYNGGMVILMPFSALMLHAWRERSLTRTTVGHAVLLACAAGAAFLLTNPYAVLDFDAFSRGFRYQLSLGRAPWFDQPADPVPLLMIRSLGIGLGWATCAAALMGALFLVRENRPAAVVLLTFPIAYVLYMSTHLIFFPRFLLPIYPALALLAGYAVHRLGHAVPRRRFAVVAGLTATIAVAPVGDTIAMNRILLRDDTRIQTRHWVMSNVPDGAKVLSDFDAAAAIGVVSTSLPIALTTSIQSQMVEDWDCARLHREGIQFVLVTGGLTVAQDRTVRQEEFFSCLDRDGVLRAEASPFGTAGAPIGDRYLHEFFWALRYRRYSGPMIRIFEIREPACTLPGCDATSLR